MNHRIPTLAATILPAMLVVAVGGHTSLAAAQPAAPAAAAAPPSATAGGAPAIGAPAPGANRRTPSELEELLGPIALYPDPLLANVLAAAVYPNEVFAAAKFVAAGGVKEEQIAAQPWEPSVKAVAEIPDAIKMMNQYPDWTVAIGQAYLVQAKDVMDTVQTLRKKAQTNGVLKSTPQQTVVTESHTIIIKPADPEIIYVPSYNPTVVYVDHHDDEVAAGLIGFGLGITAGLIIANNMDCHWHTGYVGWGGSYHGGNYYGGGNTININNGNINTGNIGSGNRVGNEGGAWRPNTAKPNAGQMPTSAAASTRRPGADAAGAAANRPATGAAAARPAQPAARPSAPAAAQGAAGRPNTPPTPARQPSTSAFGGGADTRAASQRGAASRSAGGGASRSAGGGGSRSGGASRGGGGRR